VRIAEDRRADLTRTSRIDARRWGLSMAVGIDTTDSPMLKYVPLEHLPARPVQAWLGISHLVVPRVEDEAQLWRARLGLRDETPLGDTGFALASVMGAPDRGLFFTKLRVAPAIQSLEMPREGPPRADAESFARALGDGVASIDPRFRLDGDGDVVSLDEPPAAGACQPPAVVPLQLGRDLDRITALFDAPCPGILSVPWRFLPGWRARVNGAGVDVVAVGGLTLGVPLPAGRSQIDLVYRPFAAPLVPVSFLALVGTTLFALGVAIQRARAKAGASG
jgi:hypothetical protein